MKVQFVTPYRGSHLQSYGVTIRGNVKSVYAPSGVSLPQVTTTPVGFIYTGKTDELKVKQMVS
jgi:hypothetical protein